MKKALKLFVVAVVVLAIAGMVGCSSKSNTNSTASNTASNTAASVKEAADKLKQDIKSDSKSDEKAEESIPGVRPEIKKFCDDYESIMNEYCDFMENYDSSDPKQIAKYGTLVAKYAKFSKEAEDVKNSELSDEENLYLIEVLSRVNVRLAEVSAAM